MVQERFVLPVKCAQCSAVFDLWYDLQAQEQLRKNPSASRALSEMLDSESLCWECRKMAFGEEQDEYELELEFE